MDKQQILLAKTLEAAEVPLAVDSFNQRLILQKAVYLLQSAGVRNGYRFRWYLKGPYCSELTSDAFGIVGEGEAGQKELGTWHLDSPSRKRVSQLSSLLHREGEQEHEQAKRLELFASVLFLINTKQCSEADIGGTRQLLANSKKHFSEDEIREALSELRSHGLIK
jgi:uncharacterized protein YwgA